ncbi:hypothetical protein C2S52_000867 [Perilla frutescens var. hirtella]|nr:hypothetical protein C2S51_007547 [Perilla frutescens var. frutescens]KAH6800403.1 hypothetical protein C2S52_000867 [Perilla frutescens var. hirtella]
MASIINFNYILADRVHGVCANQLVIVPCNVGAINLFNASLGKKGKKQPTWEIIKAPRQPDSK